MNKKLALSVITFSGVIAISTGGIAKGIMYAGNIALISLCCLYASAKKKNDSLMTIRKF